MAIVGKGATLTFGGKTIPVTSFVVDFSEGESKSAVSMCRNNDGEIVCEMTFDAGFPPWAFMSRCEPVFYDGQTLECVRISDDRVARILGW